MCSSVAWTFVVASLCCRCRGDPGDLHSFPTRRSSDLTIVKVEPGASIVVNENVPGAAPLITGASLPSIKGRSEEHTSELQSQSNLVCRLLLEKKQTPQVAEATASPSPAVARIATTLAA